MAMFRNLLNSNDKGFTLVEILAVLVIMLLVLPAIYTSYTTAARASELSLQRLRCLGIARQEIEYRKSLGFEGLRDSLDESPFRESNYGDSGINVETTWEEAIVDEGTETEKDAIRVIVKASTSSVSVEIKALLVEDGI